MQPSLGPGDQHSSGTAWGSVPGCTPGASFITHAWRSHSVISTQIEGSSSPHACATQRLLWSQAAEPGASSRHGTVVGCLQVHLPRVLGTMGNESLEASCVLSPIPLIPKHWWRQDMAEKGESCWYLVPLQPFLVQPPQTAVPGEPRRALQPQHSAQIPSLPSLCPTMAASSWKVPGSLNVLKTQQQQPLAKGQPQTRSELLSRVRACVSLPKGISL